MTNKLYNKIKKNVIAKKLLDFLGMYKLNSLSHLKITVVAHLLHYSHTYLNKLVYNKFKLNNKKGIIFQITRCGVILL